jgi:RNA polymerase sigma-70 factor (ECF subfamily)
VDIRGADPVVALNRLVAVGFRDGPEVALAALPALDEALAGYPLLSAVRADLLRRAGRSRESAIAYRAAMDAARTEAERRFLARRLREVDP